MFSVVSKPHMGTRHAVLHWILHPVELLVLQWTMAYGDTKQKQIQTAKMPINRNDLIAAKQRQSLFPNRVHPRPEPLHQVGPAHFHNRQA